jgi:hypothetical protein
VETDPKQGWRWAPSRRACAQAILALAVFCVRAEGADADTELRLKQLEQQNQALQQQLQQQQTLINDLAKKLSTVKSTPAEPVSADKPEPGAFNFGQVRISGEGGVGVFHTSGDGHYKNSDFRVDEAKLFIEAPLWKNFVFAYAELDLTTRERQTTPPPEDNNFHLGELYVDFEGVSRLWDKPGMLGVRVGRIDLPFGEEYISRDVIDNPLISHSLSDIWGIDEGIEFYGAIGKLDYVMAVQNGSHPSLADFNRDKSVTGRVGWRPAKWLRVSGSAMRTGNLDAAKDFMSEMWFANGFLRALGTDATIFGGEVYEGDVQAFWDTGSFKAAGGKIAYHDNSPAHDGNRNIYYWYAEAVQHVPQLRKLYGAARFSEIFAGRGFPIVAYNDFGNYFFNPFAMTDHMWRVSVGSGYQFSDHLNLKLEYTLDRRHQAVTSQTEDQHFLAAEVAFSF